LSDSSPSSSAFLSPVQPNVVQPFEGDGLDRSEFAVQLRKEDIPNLEQILRAIPSEAIAKKHDAMERVKRRFIWSSTNYSPFQLLGQEVSAPCCAPTSVPPGSISGGERPMRQSSILQPHVSSVLFCPVLWGGFGRRRIDWHPTF